MNLKQIVPHVEIGLHEDGRAILVVQDTELSDFLDDYLTEECDMPPENIQIAQRIGGEIVTMNFPSYVEMDKLESCILKISAERIEAIYRVNNN